MLYPSLEMLHKGKEGTQKDQATRAWTAESLLCNILLLPTLSTSQQLVLAAFAALARAPSRYLPSHHVPGVWLKGSRTELFHRGRKRGYVYWDMNFLIKKFCSNYSSISLK